MSRHWFKRPWRTRGLRSRAGVFGSERQPLCLAGLSQTPRQPQAAHSQGRSGPYPLPGRALRSNVPRGEEQSRLSLGSYGRPQPPSSNTSTDSISSVVGMQHW